MPADSAGEAIRLNGVNGIAGMPALFKGEIMSVV